MIVLWILLWFVLGFIAALVVGRIASHCSAKEEELFTQYREDVNHK